MTILESDNVQGLEQIYVGLQGMKVMSRQGTTLTRKQNMSLS